MKYMFIWNNKNSDYMGLWITKMPEPTRAPERFETVDIPGRAGSLILLEGVRIMLALLQRCNLTKLITF